MEEIMTQFEKVKKDLQTSPRTWLVTGVAGFIGSNILETLLKLDQTVVGLDNFTTGYQDNLDEVETLVTFKQWSNFHFIEGDICNLDCCKQACKGVEIILHQAALGSVPRSIDDPITTNSTNIDGFLNMLVAATDEGVKRFIYAASSSTYGDHPRLPKVEGVIGNPLSPYAVTKVVNELYADVFASTYGLSSIGLRYFNVFGKRQDSNGAYAAVIPKWISSLIKNNDVFINGDGETSRDFCHIDNVTQVNLLAATTEIPEAINQVYNVAAGGQTTLNELYNELKCQMLVHYPHLEHVKPNYRNFRPGDVRHSLADISKPARLLGFVPTYHLKDGLEEAITWYIDNYK